MHCVIARAEPVGTRTETRFRLSPKRMSPFKTVGASVQSTAGSRGVRISLSNAGYTTFGDGVRVLATHSIRQFPLHFPSRGSPCAIRFRTSSTIMYHKTDNMHNFHITHFIQFLASSTCTCLEPHGSIFRKTVCTCRFVWSVFLAFMSAVLEHTLPPARLFTKMHKKHTIQNCVYKLSS